MPPHDRSFPARLAKPATRGQLHAMKVSFGYSDSDDRMWIRAGGTGPLWWVTRRMALRLVSEWAALLERSVPAEAGDEPGSDHGEAPSGAPMTTEAEAYADDAARALRGRVREEHRAALGRPRPPKEGADGAAGEAPAPPGPGALVYSVDLSAREGRISLALRSSGQRQAIVAPREDSHRLLAAFVSRCRRNGWLAARLPAWLEPEEAGGSGATATAASVRPPGRPTAD